MAMPSAADLQAMRAEDMATAFDLVLFDLDGTLIRSYLRDGERVADYGVVETLRGSRTTIEALLFRGVGVAIVTNQGGPAFGYTGTMDVADKLRAAQVGLGIGGRFTAETEFPAITRPRISQIPRARPPRMYCALHHPNASVSTWRCGSGDEWRKPGPGMLLEAMRDWETTAQRTLMVGDMDSDREAAAGAGCAYRDAAEFFGAPEAER